MDGIARRKPWHPPATAPVDRRAAEGEPPGMDREVALDEVRRRRAADDGPWLAQQTASGGWRVVRVSVPGLPSARPSGSHVESRPRPPQADDPRPAAWRDVPPYGGGA